MAGPDPFDLLCESCGYNLRAFSPTERCPECGRPIEESIPDRRSGSPWQRRATPLSYVRTMALVAFSPVRTLSSIRSEPRPSSALWLADAFGVAIQVYPAALLAMLANREPPSAALFYLAFGSILAAVVVFLCVLWIQILVWTAHLATRVLGVRRIPGRSAVVASHAATVLPLGTAALWCLLLTPIVLGAYHAAPMLWSLATLLIPATLLASVVLTVLGVHVNRFANRLGAHHSLAL